MENLDQKEKKDLELLEGIKNAIESGDSEEFAKAQVAMAQNIEARILKEAKSISANEINDQAIMVKRGINPLTVAEKEYYNEVISKEGFKDIQKLMPSTIFERVFEELRLNHELLNEIAFVNTTGTTEWINRNDEVAAAWWGPLCEEIKQKLSMAFKKEKTGLYKLSAFVPVCKDMLDLGPDWLDKFVREILYESLAIALELAIIAGTGMEQPIGMIKNLKTYDTEEGYSDKEAVELKDLKPETLGTKIMAPLTKNGKRVVSKALIIVNPIDYWEKIFPQTTFLTADKSYVYGVLPIPAKVIQSLAVSKGKMISGMAKDYFMGIGSNQKIEYSDHYKFLEDERTYIAKQYANGKPLDNDSFLVFDISKMQVPRSESFVSNNNETPIPVYNTNIDARLSDLKVCGELSPGFNKSIFAYSAETTNASNTIRATAIDDEATIEISINGEQHVNNTPASWIEGENIVEIIVTSDQEDEKYTVIVTKS